MFDFLSETAFRIGAAFLILLSSFLGTSSPASQSQVNTESNEGPATISMPEKLPSTIFPSKQSVIDPKEDLPPTNNATTTLPSSTTTEPLPKMPVFSKAEHEKALKATLNVYCIIDTLGPENPLTASAVMIHSSGIILTNAHVAQYILLSDFLRKDAIDCTIRGGSPAKDLYRAEILYISPGWIEEHKQNIFTKSPVGTGKDDYAFLIVTESVGDSSLPEYFDYIEPETNDRAVEENDEVLISSYPAGILDALSIRHVLFAISTQSSIKKLLTFGDNKVDVISTGGSYLAQKGSSGGGVINKKGKLIGLFVTSTQEEAVTDRDLRAVTLSHIERSLEAFGNISLEKLVSGNARRVAIDFNKEVSPLLAEILIEEIRNR